LGTFLQSKEGSGHLPHGGQGDGLGHVTVVGTSSDEAVVSYVLFSTSDPLGGGIKTVLVCTGGGG
jgi:hypothetical protein